MNTIEFTDEEVSTLRRFLISHSSVNLSSQVLESIRIKLIEVKN